ncbi:MAG: hypothetical protein AMXMBFR57_25700 [Acidimicrobiia bacterium]
MAALYGERGPVVESDPRALAGVLSVSRDTTVIAADPVAVDQARRQFASDHAIVLKEFLAPALLAWVRERVAQAQFRHKVHPASGDEECMYDNDAIWLLRFLLSEARVLRAIESITGVEGLTKCQVRVYRFVPDSGQRHDWHDDVGEGRRLGLSINLSETTFDGGNLQVRDRESGRLTADIRNTGAGDAAVFRLGTRLQHQVLPVTGAQGRVVVAGWFRAETDAV